MGPSGLNEGVGGPCFQKGDCLGSSVNKAKASGVSGMFMVVGQLKVGMLEKCGGRWSGAAAADEGGGPTVAVVVRQPTDRWCDGGPTTVRQPAAVAVRRSVNEGWSGDGPIAGGGGSATGDPAAGL
ncbi:hypothetical protein Q3G72_014495 [Acer saccharum]|nr:hypothetical protein Q3G72_014495 [Acer saccharum]